MSAITFVNSDQKATHFTITMGHNGKDGISFSRDNTKQFKNEN